MSYLQELTQKIRLQRLADEKPEIKTRADIVFELLKSLGELSNWFRRPGSQESYELFHDAFQKFIAECAVMGENFWNSHLSKGQPERVDAKVVGALNDLAFAIADSCRGYPEEKNNFVSLVYAVGKLSSSMLGKEGIGINNNPANIRSNALDVAVMAMRIYLGGHGQEGIRDDKPFSEETFKKELEKTVIGS